MWVEVGGGRGEAGAHLSIQPVYEAHHGRDVQSRNREMGGRGKGTGWVLSHGRFSISPFFACALIIPKRDLSRRMFDLPERSSPVRSLSHRRPAPSAPSASLAPGHPTRATRPLSHTRPSPPPALSLFCLPFAFACCFAWPRTQPERRAAHKARVLAELYDAHAIF